MVRQRALERPIAALVAALCLAVGAGAASAQAAGDEPEGEGILAIASAQLAVERELLGEDGAAFRAARTAAVGARLRLDELENRFVDQLTAGTAEPLALAREVLAAAEAQSIAALREERALTALADRLRRIATLERLAAPAPPVASTDSVAGRWRLAIDPDLPVGSLELAVLGDEITGSLIRFGQSPTAVHGSLTNGQLRLDPIAFAASALRSLVGSFDASSDSLQGSWQDHDPATGAPLAAGTWTARRLRPEEIEQEDIPQ